MILGNVRMRVLYWCLFCKKHSEKQKMGQILCDKEKIKKNLAKWDNIYRAALILVVKGEHKCCVVLEKQRSLCYVVFDFAEYCEGLCSWLNNFYKFKEINGR